MNEQNKVFAERLKALREKAGIHQREVAEKVGVKRSTATSWEAGHKIPRPFTLQRLADLFSVSVDYLLGKEDTPPYNVHLFYGGKTVEFNEAMEEALKGIIEEAIRKYKQIEEEEKRKRGI